jgi:beta-lactamase class A
MKQKPEQFSRIINQKDSLEVQIIYTMIDRDENNVPSFRSFYFNVDSTHYFYPASTVKLPMSLLALEKINNLNVEGLDKYTPMFHDSVYYGQVPVLGDSTSENGLASVAHYVKKILVVSDNDAHNRLYEFLGQKATNEILNQKGYHVRFLHRLERFLPPDQNRHTEAIRFVKEGKLLWQQPGLVNTDSIQAPAYALRGKAYYKNDTLLINKKFYGLYFSLKQFRHRHALT